MAAVAAVRTVAGGIKRSGISTIERFFYCWRFCWCHLPLYAVRRAKRVVYLLPLYAPCALLCSGFLTDLPVKVQNWFKMLSEKYRLRFPVNSYGKALTACIILAFLMASSDLIYAFYSNRKKSLRPLFEKCAKLEHAGYKVSLMSAQERTRGAAYFYLHHELEEILSKTGVPSAGEYWIIRSKRKTVDGEKYADHHYLIGEK